jgi:phosphatidylserine/phosphatidylglycerophosphate/cardiolipin synthase-like enzyme
MRSFTLNFEVGALIDDPAVAATLRDCFVAQTRQSSEITAETVRGWSVAKRLQHGAARLFSPLL